MKKKALSLALALVMCLGLTVPALAAPLRVPTPYTGLQVTLSDVTAESTAAVHGTWSGNATLKMYTVPVGSSITIDRYCDNSITKCELGADGAYTGGEAVHRGYSSDGEVTIVWDESYANAVWWVSVWQIDSDGFLVKVGGTSTPTTKPTEPEQPTDPQPTTPPTIEVEKIPAKGTAKASTQTVTVDGKKVEFQMYAILDANGNGTNYIKLRDMAHILNGTKAQFSVGYSNQTGITATSGQPYQDTGSEMKTPFSGDRNYSGGGLKVQVNGKSVEMTAISLLDDQGNGYTYFKLRDLGKALGFNVGFSREQGVYIESDKPYVG